MTLGSGWCGRWPERAVRQPEATEGQVDDGSELGQDPEAAGAADLRLHGRVGRLGTAVTGSIRGGLIAAFSAAVFHGIGGHFAEVAAANRAALGAGYAGVLGTGLKAAQFATQIGAHAMAGGVISMMQGGKFGHGFVSAGATKAASPWIKSIGAGARELAPARVATAALVGGTVSAATGGKFANGAVTATFAYAFNEIRSRLQPRDAQGKTAIDVAGPEGAKFMTLITIKGQRRWVPRNMVGSIMNAAAHDQSVGDYETTTAQEVASAAGTVALAGSGAGLVGGLALRAGYGVWATSRIPAAITGVGGVVTIAAEPGDLWNYLSFAGGRYAASLTQRGSDAGLFLEMQLFKADFIMQGVQAGQQRAAPVQCAPPAVACP